MYGYIMIYIYTYQVHYGTYMYFFFIYTYICVISCSLIFLTCQCPSFFGAFKYHHLGWPGEDPSGRVGFCD